MIEKICARLEELKKCNLCKDMNCSECEHRYHDDNCDENYQKLLLDKCKEIVQEVADKGGWIPTESELFPKMGRMVLASVDTTDAKHEIIITKYQNQDYWHNGTITAWMPLPPVYQKGE